MAYNNADMAFTLPSVFGSPSEALDQAIQLKERSKERQAAQDERDRSFIERQREFDLRNQDRNDMENYRKVKMIEDLTDLSKHQTGSDIANAIGSQKVSDIVNRYTANAKDMSYADLFSSINKDMASTVAGMDAMKNELENSDKAATILKQKFPELNITQLMKDHRADVINRRVGKNNDFVNPLQVPPSEFDQKLADPEFLSRYTQGNSNLVKAIQNPTGLDESTAFVGTPDSHMKYEAKIPSWKQPSFTPEQMAGGFLKNGVVPQLKLKESILPMDKLPQNVANKSPFKMIDKEVLQRFTQDPSQNLELISATRNKFPQYDSFNATEKEYAKANVLHDYISQLDQLDYHPTGFTKASRPVTNINLGQDVKYNDIYTKTKALLPKEGFFPVSALPSDQRNFYVESINKSRAADDKLDENKLVMVEADNGDLRVIDNRKGKEDVVGVFTKTGANLGANKPQKQQQKILREETNKPTLSTKKKDPLGLGL